MKEKLGEYYLEVNLIYNAMWQQGSGMFFEELCEVELQF